MKLPFQPADKHWSPGIIAPAIEAAALLQELNRLQADELLTKRRTVSCYTDVGLAMRQWRGRAQIDLLRKLLDLPPFNYPKGDPE